MEWQTKNIFLVPTSPAQVPCCSWRKNEAMVLWHGFLCRGEGKFLMTRHKYPSLNASPAYLRQVRNFTF